MWLKSLAPTTSCSACPFGNLLQPEASLSVIQIRKMSLHQGLPVVRMPFPAPSPTSPPLTSNLILIFTQGPLSRKFNLKITSSGTLLSFVSSFLGACLFVLPN